MVALYNETVLDHYQHPRNVGMLAAANAVGRAENAACGDELQLYLEVRGDQIQRVRFRTFGCAASIAAGSRLTELLVGASLAQARLLTGEAINTALGGLPPLKVHGSALAADALWAALEDHRKHCETVNPGSITQISL